MKQDRLISVPIRIITTIGRLQGLDEEGLIEINKQLDWIELEVSERNREILKERNSLDSNDLRGGEQDK